MIRRILYVAIALFTGATVSFAESPRVQRLAAAIGGNDESARIRARQLLPREDADEVAAALLPLLSSDDQNVWRTAFNVLADVCNQASAPGRDADRAAVSARLMPLVDARQTAEIRVRALGLLPLVIPDGYDVSPMAAMLAENDPLLRERARAALEETGTPEAAAALAAALPRADPAFQIALLHALSRLKQPATLPAIRKLCTSNAANVRAAAALAQHWSADNEALKQCDAVVIAADERTRPDALDALLRLLALLEGKPQLMPKARERYIGLLDSPRQAERDAALAGLGRIGDANDVGHVLKLAVEAENPTRLVALAALRTMPGTGVSARLGETYGSVPAELRLLLIGILGDRGDPPAVRLLSETAGGDDAAQRIAAIEALGTTGSVDALPALTTAAGSDAADQRAAARAAILAIAQQRRDAGDAASAGKASLAAWPLADDDAQRQQLLADLAAGPAAEAIPLLFDAAKQPALQSNALRALLATAGAIAAGGDRDRAVGIYNQVRELNPPMELMRGVVASLRALGVEVDSAAMLGIIADWRVIGPFELGGDKAGWDKDFIPPEKVDLQARHMAGKRRLDWVSATSAQENGVVDLLGVLGSAEASVAYAYAEVEVPESVDAMLLMGADDGIRAWVNGKEVHNHLIDRGLTVDSDQAKVALRAGRNTILLKISQNNGGWAFCARLATSDGRPLRFSVVGP